MRNMICSIRVRLLTDIFIFQTKNWSYKDANVNLKSWKHQDIKSRDTTMSCDTTTKFYGL